MFKMLKRTVAAMLVAFTVGAPTAWSQDLVMGMAGAFTSADPHFHALGPNNNIGSHIFGALVEQDEQQRLVPGLATDWRPVDDNTWEFRLRRGVRFHDGSEFAAEDVAATIRRVPWVPNSPSSFAVYTRSIEEVQIVDPYTIRFRTRGPYPLLPNDLANIFIVSRAHERSSTGDFNAGRAAIGAGPYRLVEFVPGDRVVLQRNDNYWGPRPHWQRVTLRLIANDAARVAALLAGDVQIIENVPPDSVQRVRSNQQINVAQITSNRVIYLAMDSFREQSPFVTDRGGAQLPNNPLRDPRVRRAMSIAINRQAITSRIMEGTALPAGGLLPEGFFGVNPRLTPPNFDPDAARRLLAEAGYPNGFGLTIHGPNDRYVKDESVLQAIGPMFTRIGIETRVVTLPWATFAAQASAPNYAFSVLLAGWGSGTGEISSPLRALIASVNRDRGWGGSNRGRYANAQVDQLLLQALATVDNERREQLLIQSTDVAMADTAIIPLHYQINIWGMRRGLTYAARAGEETLAMSVRPAAN